jgi:hypothetical protein
MPSWLRAIAGPAVHDAAASANALARRIALLAAGALAFAVAAAFVIAAIYTLIDDSYGPIAAQLSIAGLFVVVGIVFVLIARSAARQRPPGIYGTLGTAEPVDSTSLPTVATAFALGFARGIRRRDR